MTALASEKKDTATAKEITITAAGLPTGVKLTETALTLPPSLTQAEWVEIAARITKVGHGYWWWIGDLAAFARHRLDDPDKHIEELADATGAGVKYINLIGFAAEKFAVRDRVHGLSVSHHLSVVHLPNGERNRMLAKAKTESWPVRLLQQEIKPPDKQYETIVLRVKRKTASQRDFRADLQILCTRYAIKAHDWGKMHPKAAKAKLGGKRAMRLA